MEDRVLNIVLASKSPRRRQLLSEIFEDFEIITADCDESLPEDVHPRDGVKILAVRKGEVVLSLTAEDSRIISSDTLVELCGVALGKPKNEEDAKNMLRSLSNKGHNVHTGVAVHYRGRVASGVDTTRVYFKELSDLEIEEYILTGEPMDKAGSYGIQGLGGKFVTNYEGRFDTVVGLSAELVKELVKEVLTDD